MTEQERDDYVVETEDGGAWAETVVRENSLGFENQHEMIVPIGLVGQISNKIMGSLQRTTSQSVLDKAALDGVVLDSPQEFAITTWSKLWSTVRGGQIAGVRLVKMALSFRELATIGDFLIADKSTKWEAKLFSDLMDSFTTAGGCDYTGLREKAEGLLNGK